MIGFRWLTRDDLPLMHHWINDDPLIREIWTFGRGMTVDELETKYGARADGKTPTSPYVITYAGEPIGYIQWYRWRDYPEESGPLELDEEAASLDLFIGEAAMRGRGIGTAVLVRFLQDHVFTAPDIVSCVISPDAGNAMAIRAYEKAGCKLVRVMEHPEEPTPIALMRVSREEALSVVLPRAVRVPLVISRSALLPPASFDMGRLPPEILAVTGAISRVEEIPQGLCNLVRLVEGEKGRFVLKVAEGEYRVEELRAEHMAMQALSAVDVMVPRSLAFAVPGNCGVQVRAYAPGVPLRAALREMGLEERRDAIRQMGAALAAIHQRPGATEDWPWSRWLNWALETAQLNLEHGVIDLDDFPGRSPADVLRQLLLNRPSAGTVAILHGDYRPKNLLWNEGRISAVIDWSFVDVGDPYYDLAVILSYQPVAEERDAFLSGYGVGSLDQQRLAWYKDLGLFLNV